MDRDELQDRIRQRRSGGDPYRRGGVADEGAGGYQRFEPAPEDSQARRSLRPGEQRRDAFDEEGAAAGAVVGAAAVSSSSEPPDITREADDWTERPSLVPPLPPSEPVEPPPPPFSDEPAYVDNYDDAADDGTAYPYDYDDWEDGRERRSSGAGAFAILGFLALGVLALGAGAVLAGVFSSDPGVGGVDPTLTPIPSIQESTPPSESASAPPSSDASTSPSTSPPASGEPVVFPDGFTAVVEPCLPGTMRRDGSGCDSNAATNSGSVEIYAGFRNGSSADLIGAKIIGPEGNQVGEGSVDLGSIRGCGNVCNGWTYFQFGNLVDPGTYDVEITRNGDLAATTSFEVEG